MNRPSKRDIGLRDLCLGSWWSARMRVATGAIPLDAAACAGMLLDQHGDATVAKAHVWDGGPYAARVREYLERIIESERAALRLVGGGR